MPGLFESSQEAVKAYVAYFNSASDICGRKLALKAYDSRTDAAADQQAYTKACDETFAMIGSMSAFDSGGASTAESCGLPDVRTASVTKDRSECSICFGAQSTASTEFQNAVPDFVLKNHPDAAQHAAMLYINAGAAVENGKNQAAAMTKRGMKFDYVQGIDISEFNYAPYVQQMKDKGIEYVQMIGASAQFVRLAQAMKQQGFEPEVYMLDPTAYTSEFVDNGGSDVEGTTIFVNFTPFEEAASNKELQLYLSWLQQVKPGAEPSFFGLFAWSAARLFVEQASGLGGKLTRASFIDGVRRGPGLGRQRDALAPGGRVQAHRRLLAVHPAAGRQVGARGRHQVHLQRHDLGRLTCVPPDDAWTGRGWPSAPSGPCWRSPRAAPSSTPGPSPA